MENYGLYIWDKRTYCKSFNSKMKIKAFEPSIHRPLFWPLCKMVGPYKRSKLLFVELLWAICSSFRYKLYYVEMDGKIVHISYVVYKSIKFPFLKEKDIQIGPCYTAESARGNRIYPSTISYILTHESQYLLDVGNAYMIIRDANIPSINGVTAVGFFKCANLDKSKLLKRYSVRQEE